MSCQVPNPAFDVTGEDAAPPPDDVHDAGDDRPTGPWDAAADRPFSVMADTLAGTPEAGHAHDASKDVSDVGTTPDAVGPQDAGILVDGATMDAAPPASGVLIAVGNNALRMISTDLGQTWQTNHHEPAGTERDAVFGASYAGDYFFALGWKVLRSRDGVSWEAVQRPDDQWYFEAAYGQGTYMMVGGFGAIAVSQDALAWRRLRGPSTEPIYGVAFLDGSFAISLRTLDVFVTRDLGTTWTLLPGLRTEHVMACDGAFRAREECGVRDAGGDRSVRFVSVTMRARWPTIVDRSVDGVNFTHAFTAPSAVRDFAFAPVR